MANNIFEGVQQIFLGLYYSTQLPSHPYKDSLINYKPLIIFVEGKCQEYVKVHLASIVNGFKYATAFLGHHFYRR